MKNKIILVLGLVNLLTVIINAQTSIITGKVVDGTTGESLIGVNVIVNELPNFGTITDESGKFKIVVPVGSYSLKFSYVGYISQIKTDIVVQSGKETNINIKLNPSPIQINEVTVSNDYFDKSIQTNNLSTVTLSSEEIRRSPGSAQDFQRILQGMAGVSFSNDQNNELLVRGGSPNENLTILDEIELHSTNHFPNEHNSGGPINMVNVDLIENIQFSTGGFISKYGDKLSSVIQITTREGTRNNFFLGNVNLSMAGVGGIFEGNINGGKGSWIISARKSYIDLIVGSIGITAIPYFYDAQFKVVYDLSPNQKLSWSGIYGNDKINIKGESEEVRLEKANASDTVGIERVDDKQSQYATGITLKSIWNKNIYSLTTLYYNNYKIDLTVDEIIEKRKYDSNGRIFSSDEFKKRSIYRDNHHNSTLAFKNEWLWNFNKTNELNFGISIATGEFIQNLFINGDSTRYFINGKWTPPIVVSPSYLEYRIKLFDYYKYYAYFNNKIKLFNERLILNVGLRYDYFSYSKRGNISPRFSGTFYIVPSITSLSFAYGEYYQTQNYPTYGDREHKDVNRYLKNTHARHFVLGFEQILEDGLKLNLEAYHKSYDDIPISEEFIYFDNKTFRSTRNINIGKQKIYGIDLLIQQKLVKDYFGTLAYSRMWTKFEDPRIGYEGKTFVSDYDFPHVLTLIVGKRFKNLRSLLNESNFLIKYTSYLLPFSDDMEISLRWRYASGKPYTERQWRTTQQYWENGVRWSNGDWVTGNEYNNKRYPDYHRLDIAFNSRFNFEKWSIAVFLSIQNLYNRKNIAYYEYQSDGIINPVYQFSLLPVVGIDVRF